MVSVCLIWSLAPWAHVSGNENELQRGSGELEEEWLMGRTQK